MVLFSWFIDVMNYIDNILLESQVRIGRNIMAGMTDS